MSCNRSLPLVSMLRSDASFLRCLMPLLLLLAGYACIWGSQAVGMLLYVTYVPTDSDGSELLGMQLTQLALAWLGPCLLVGVVYLVFHHVQQEGPVREPRLVFRRLAQLALLLLAIPGMFMLIPAALLLAEWW